MSTSEPLVWLPFDASHLDPAPAGLRYEKADPTRDDWERPAGGFRRRRPPRRLP